jgi:hypothetical protein
MATIPERSQRRLTTPAERRTRARLAMFGQSLLDMHCPNSCERSVDQVERRVERRKFHLLTSDLWHPLTPSYFTSLLAGFIGFSVM